MGMLAWGSISWAYVFNWDRDTWPLALWAWYVLLFWLSGMTKGPSREVAISALVLSLMIQSTWGWFIWHSGGVAMAPVFGTFYASNQYAGFLGLLSPILVGMAVRSSGLMKWVHAIGASFAYAMLVMSGSRGGILAAVLGLAALGWMGERDRRVLAVVAVSAMAIGLLLPALTPGREHQRYRRKGEDRGGVLISAEPLDDLRHLVRVRPSDGGQRHRIVRGKTAGS